MNLSLKHIIVVSKPAAGRTVATLLLLVSASAFSQNVGEYKPDASTVLLLHMNESSGTAVADSSGNGNNGTATGTTIVGGRFGNARNFNGTSDKVVVSDHPSLNGITNITLEAWIYPTDTTNATGKVIARKDTGVSELYSLYQQGTQLMWVSVNTSPTTLFSKNYILPINKWSHVAVEYDSTSSEVIFYLNGKEVGKQTGVTGSIGSSSANLAIGANPTASANYFTGYIDEVRVSKVIRSANSFNLQLPPKSLLATPIGTSINLSWLNGGGAVGLLKYKVYRGTDSTTLALVDSTLSASYSDSSLSAGTTYYYRVSAVDSTGFEGAMSVAASATTYDATPPEPPTNLATLSGNAQITLKWSKNTETDFLRYRIYGGTSPNPTTKTDSTLGGSITDTTKIITGLVSGEKYYFRVTAVDSSYNESAFSSEDSAVVLPSKPQSLTATALSDTSIKLMWVSGGGKVNYYRIYKNVDSTSLLFEDTTSSLEFTFATLSSATRYYFKVAAVNSADAQGDSSNLASAVTNPTQVQNLIAHSVDTTSANLSWDPVGGAGVHYRIYRGVTSSSLAFIDTTSLISFTNGGLLPAKTYFYRVSAVNSAGVEGAQSDYDSTTTLPSQVRGLAVTAVDTTSVALQWNAVSGTPLRYRIYRGTDSSTVSNVDSTTSTSVIISGLSSATEYFFRVSALNKEEGEGELSYAVDSATIPSKVGNLVASAIDTTQISLTWNAVSGTISNYNIYRGVDSTALALVGTSPSPSFTSTSLAPATLYYYRVSAVNTAGGEGSQSYADKAITRPSQVRNLVATAIDTTTTGLAWNDVSGLRSHFNIYRGPDSTSLALIDTTSSTSYTNVALPTATKYFYRVSAINTIAEEGVQSVADSAVTIPSQVRNLASSAIDTAQISLTWNAVSGTISNYTIYRGTDSLSMTPIGSTASTSSVVTGLSAATRYYFRISAFNEASQEGEKSFASTTVTRPSRVRNLTASTIDTTTIGLTWNDVAGLRSHFKIYRGSDSTSLALVDTTSSTSFTNIGLPSATKYFYQVSAVNTINEEGVKSYSDSAITIPSQVRNLSAVAIDTTQISLTWNAVSGTINNYTIYQGTDSLSMTPIGSTASTSSVVTGLSAATRYFFRISAFNEASQEGEKSFASTTVTRPSQVRNLTASTIDTTKIGLTWNDVSGLRSHFRIYRGSDSTSLAFIDSTWSTSYTNVGLPTATKYFYRVSAVDTIAEEGVKSFSDSAVTLPSWVRDLATTAIDTAQISLTWNAVSGTINNYTIYRGTDSLSMTPIGSTTSTSSIVTGLTSATRYYFRISAFNEASQEGERSFTSTTVTRPSRVRNLTASTIDTTTIGLTWNDVAGLRSHFKIYRGSDSTSLALVDTTSSTSFTNIGLPSATKYFYQVSAVNTINEEGVKSYSDSAITIPSQVRNLSAVAIDTTQISLTWNAVSGTINNYTIYRGTDSLSMTPIGSTASTSSVVTGLSAATRYYFRISAFNEASQEGERSFASTTVTRPSQVRNLTASTIDTTKIGLTWNDVTGLRLHFRIYRGSDSTSLALIDTTSSTSYTNIGLPSATKYFYSVSAVNTINEEGVKSFSDSAVTLPSQVRNLAATAIDTAQISLTWNAVSGTINNYTIYQGTDSLSMTPIGSTVSTSSVVTGLTAATRYFFRILAFNEASQEGEKSFAPTTVTRPSQVRNLTASTIDTTKIGLTWNDVSGLRSHFNIYRGSDSTSLALIDSTSSTSYTNVGLVTSTKYFYRVFAVNTIIEEGLKSFSDSAVTLPSQVRNLSTVAIDTNRIAITWNAVPGSPLRYRIYRGADSTSLIQVDSTAATSFNDLNLLPATSYYYRVAALNEVSAEGLRSASALGVTLPSQARGLIATTFDTTSIALSWNAVSGAPARYRIYQSSDSLSMALVDSTVSINYTRINLVSSTRYFFRIVAVNILGNEGVQSDAKTDVTVPSQVRNLAASPIDTSRIFLSWNAVPGSPAQYRIYRGLDSSSVIIIDSAIGISYTSTGLDPSTRYFYRVRAVNEISVVGTASFANSTVTHAATPLNVVATTLDTNRITTTWLPGRNGASYYRVYRGLDSSSTSFIDTTSSTSFTHAGLTPSTHYFFRISAVNSISIEGALSYAVDAVTNPAQPINLSAGNIDTTRIQLTWQSGGGTNSLYRVYHSSDGIAFAQVDSAFAVSAVDDSLIPSTRYYYKVSAVNSVGVEGEQSSVVSDVTRPTTPLDLVAATVNSATIRLTWLSGGHSVTRYVVYRGPDSVTVVGHDSTTLLLYDDTLGLVPGVEYFYRVAAVNNVGAQSTLSYAANAFTTLPQIDSLLAVAMDTMKVRLSWKQVAGTNIKYRVYRGADSIVTVLVDSVIDAAAYFDFNPPPSARLYYRVAGVSGGIEGPKSFSVTVITKPSTPINVVAQTLDTARIRVTWNNGGGPINIYFVYRGTTPGALVRIDSTIATSYTDSMGLMPSTRYYYQVSATNIVDVEGVRSALYYDVSDPAPPHLISTITIDTSQIMITWIAGTGGALRYRIYRSLDSLNWFSIDSTTGLNYTDMNLLPGTRYYYRIVAVNELGRGGMYSNNSSAVTNPSSAKNLVATALDTSRIALSWTQNGTQDQYYRIFGGTDTTALGLIDSTLALTDTLSGLIPSTRYYYQVSVVNTVGVEGIRSVVVSAVTYPVPPRNLTAATVDSNTVDLAWDASPQAAHYRIYSSVDTSSVFSFFDTTSAITYQARNLTPSTRYNFEVAAVNALATESQKCLPASAVTKPAKPKNLIASSLDTSRIQLTWISGGGVNAKYDVYRSLNDTIFALIDSTTTTSYTSLLLSPSNRYYFKVSAFNSIGVEGPQSASTTDVTYPSTPRNLAAYGINQTTIRLTWQSGGGPVTVYRIYSGPDSLSLTFLDSTTSTSYDHVGLAPTSVHAYRVSAVNFVGQEGTKSNLVTSSPVLFGEYITDGNTVLLFHLNESAGSLANDASGNGNNGIASGTVIVNGKFGNGRKFFNPSEYVSVASASSLEFGVGDFTLESWVNTLGVPDPGGHVFHKRGTGGLGWYTNVNVGLGTVSITLYSVPSAPATYGLSGHRLVSDGKWHHVAYVKSGLNLSIFVDGVLDTVGTMSTSPIVDNDGSLLIGLVSGGAGGDLFKGVLDEVRVSTIARSPNQFDLQLPPVFLSANDSLQNARLQWQNGGGGVGLLRYKIYRGLDSVIVALIDSTTSTSYLNTGLAKGTRYFYRITAVDSTGFEGAKSYAKFARTQASQIATVLDSVSGEQFANIDLSFHLAGIVADTLVIKGWYAFQGDTTFRRATLQRSPARLVTRDNIDLWMSLTDIAGRDTSIQFYLTIDAPDTSARSNTITIRADMNQPPSSTVDDILTPKAADIVLTYHLFDPEKDILSIIPQYSTNGGVTWRSPAQIIGQVVSIDTTKYNATFVWKSKLDIDTSAFVRFRVIPLDRDTGTGTPQSIDFEVINNSVATIQFAPVLPLKSGDIDINYVLTNRIGTLMSLKPEYSLDGGATFRPITKFVGDTSNIPLSKYTGTLTWKSRVEQPNIDTPLVAVRITPSNVLGPGIADTTEIFILDNRAPSFAGPDSAIADSARATLFWKAASDGHGPITYFIYQSTTPSAGSVLVDSVIGNTSRTIAGLTNFTRYYFRVFAQDVVGNRDSNKVELSILPSTAPSLEFVQVSVPPIGIVSNDVTIQYRILGDALDTVQIGVSYSPDNGRNWIQTTSIKENIGRLIPNLPRDSIRWYSRRDLPFSESDSMLVQFVPVGRGRKGAALSSSLFKLDNIAPAFDGVQAVTDDTSGNTLNVRWTRGSDTHVPIRYFVYVSTVNNDKLFDTAHAITQSDTGIAVQGLNNFVKYYIAVRSMDVVGNLDSNKVVLIGTPTKTLRIDTLIAPRGRMRDSIYFRYSITAAPEDTIQLLAEYSANAGSTWKQANGIRQRSTNITTANFSDSLLWITTIDSSKMESIAMKLRVTPVGRAATGLKKMSSLFEVDTKEPQFSGRLFVFKNNMDSVFGRMQFGWTSANDLSEPVTYMVFKSETSGVYNKSTLFATTTSTAVTFSGLQSNTLYYLKLWAIDSVGNINSTYADTSRMTSLLCDYNDDGRVDSRDLPIFVNGWRTKNANIADIGPVIGTIPKVSAAQDGTIDIEDLTIFIRMWNWAFDHNKGAFSFAQSLSKSYADSAVRAGEVHFPEESIIQPGETKSVALSMRGFKDFSVAMLTLKYDPADVRIDSVTLGKVFGQSSAKPLVFERLDEKRGLMHIAVAALEDLQLDAKSVQQCLQVYISPLKRVRDEKIRGEYELYAPDGTLIQFGNVVVTISDRPKIPLTFAMSQNYPNPFNPSTTIDYQLPVACNVTLKIFNIIGQEVATLINQELSAGYYGVHWSTSTATGVYFYVIHASSLVDDKQKFSSVKKMMLLH